MRVVIADHTGSLARQLGTTAASVADAERAVAAVRAERADAVLVHADLPPEGGVAVIPRLVAQGAAVVLVGAVAGAPALAGALRAGARAVIDSHADDALLDLALATAHTGGLLVAPTAGFRDLLAAGDHPFAELSPRERDVLSQLATGADAARAAGRLGLAPKTVRHHVRAILGKLGVPDAASAGRLARGAGLG